MRIFAPMYEMVMRWSAHPKAVRYLGGLSFAESSFFPVPPDVMLAPMSLAKPEQAYYYAWITTAFSVLGGIVGYLLGMFLLEMIWPLLESSGYDAAYFKAVEFFDRYGVGVVLIAGFSPFPYKIITLSAGATGMNFIYFLVASALGRGARFYLVAWLMKTGGAKYEPAIKRWIEWLGWAVIVLGIVVYLVVKG